ncbi:hypothetical protein [Metallibacterium sp.]
MKMLPLKDESSDRTEVTAEYQNQQPLPAFALPVPLRSSRSVMLDCMIARRA